MPLRIHAWVWGACGVLVLGFIGATGHFDGRDFWQGWVESGELRSPGYAEKIFQANLFRTRANTWSNLAFVVVGFYGIALGWSDLRARATRMGSGFLVSHPGMSVLFGVACCGLGFGSGLYHASLTRWGQHLDVASMYPPLLACIAINLGRWFRRTGIGAGVAAGTLSWLLASLVMVVGFLLYRYKWSMSAALVLGSLILAVGAGGLLDLLCSRGRMRFRWLAWSTGALVIGVACRQLDVAGRFSGPDTWLQGHALWHILTALSLGLVYAYYRAESGGPDPAASAAPNETTPAGPATRAG